MTVGGVGFADRALLLLQEVVLDRGSVVEGGGSGSPVTVHTDVTDRGAIDLVLVRESSVASSAIFRLDLADFGLR